MPWTRVCAAEELPDGAMIEHGELDDAVMVARAGGALFAVQGSCTHEECPLAEGTLLDREVECYCHGAVFDLRTGEALVGPALESLRTYPVRELDGAVEVEL